jgi:uncharacterized protein
MAHLGAPAVFIDEAGVRGYLHTPDQPTGDGLALTHGAGANCQSPLLRALADSFCDAGLIVLRYDLPFRQSRPHGPPMPGGAERDREGVARALEFIKSRGTSRVFAAGHSYGGRQSTMLLSEHPELADGLLLLSYPLHPPTQPTNLRTAHFPNLRTPALFVHGSRDGFGSAAEMMTALKLIPTPTRLLTIEGAGHELLTKKNERELPQVIATAFFEMFPKRAT